MDTEELNRITLAQQNKHRLHDYFMERMKLGDQWTPVEFLTRFLEVAHEMKKEGYTFYAHTALNASLPSEPK